MKLWQEGEGALKNIDQFTVGNDREVDLHLAKYDCIASAAHAQMLGKIGLLTAEESDALVAALKELEQIAEDGRFTIEADFEDVHSKIEFLLIDKLGDLGKKIHTARSRNDQVLVALQLYLKDELNQIKILSKNLFDHFLQLAHKHKDHLMPGYTHMQVAMPSSFGLWFSAYAEAIIDDLQMVKAAYEIVDQNPLGSAAGYGSAFAIDRQYTTAALGFSTLKYNVVNAQMGRGKVEKITATAISMIAATLSKMAMDICLYMGQDFGFISFPDELTTGSSIMPHKKNPDVFELIRGKCNLVQALPNQMILLSNNLPSGYHREMQLTKSLLINGINSIKECLSIFEFCIQKINIKETLLDDPKYDLLFSVDTLDGWVQDGMPFRDAYLKMKMNIAEGTYKPNRTVAHTHLGSRGQLALDAIAQKMTNVLW
ncbi:MAG: argininosuccinate lyase [Bacteroidetes bacterium]|nr:argininosuccinate lyase [Bacteroidota bacterium]MDA0937666.1 argininosuccinate lyase [Bacteroidota bacterium]MDA1344368.1 argininosuccinate lyase [Bacteroidota bacterium]